MSATQLASSSPSPDEISSSQSSSAKLSGGTIAAIAIGTVLAVGLVCVLLFWPQLLFTWLIRSRPQNHRPSRSEEVPLEDLPPERPGRASGNDGSSNGADDAGSRRRRPEVVHSGSIQQRGNHIIISRPSGSPIVIKNNIYIKSTDYLHPLPALNSPRNRDPAPPAVGVSQNTQRASRTPNAQFDPPNGGIPPQRRTRVVPPAPPPRAPIAELPERSGFWNVADWVHGVAPRHIPRSPARRQTDSPLYGREQPPVQRHEESSTRERAFDVPGASPENRDAVKRFQLVTAPARVRAPITPTHGDDGFWVREARENRWRRQEKEDRRDRQDREDKRERQEREEKRERDRYEREERRERERLEREDRRERQEREERRERQEREDRRERQDGIR